MPCGRRRLAACAAGLSAPLAVRMRGRLPLPAPVTTAWAFVAPVSIAAGFRRSKWRDAAVWAAQMWAYKNAFELPKDHRDRHERRTHFDYPIAVDSVIGAGMPPGQRLQRRLRRQGRLSRLDKTLTFFYLTWEAEPHLVMAWLRWRRPDSFAAAAGRLAATFDSTLIFYWALPTAPPWWVSEEKGRMHGDLQRVTVEVFRWLKGERNPTGGDHEMGANVFAAMPSDHFASAAMTAILLSEQDRRLGALGWAYAVILGFALVYLGEHYVTDLIAGLALALAVNRRCSWAQRVAGAVLSLGPG